MPIEIVPIEDLYRLEEEGRNIATHYRDRSDEEAYDKVISWAENVIDNLDKIEEPLLIAESDIADELDHFMRVLRSSGEFIIDDATECKEKKVSIGKCHAMLAEDQLEIVDFVFKRSIGKKYGGDRCTWLLGVKEPYTLSAAINDFTSCFHRLIDVYAKYGLRKIQGLERSFMSMDATEDAIKFCRYWENSTYILDDNWLYTTYDYGNTSCIAFKDKAELRVGSVPGHKTHVDLKNGKVEYYDVDAMTSGLILKKLLEEQGLKCTIHSEKLTQALKKTEVECEGLTKENMENVAKIISAATSMDFRIGGIDSIPTGVNPFKELHYWRYAYDREVEKAEEQKQLGNEEEYRKHMEKAEKIKRCIENAPENPEFRHSYGANVEYCAIKVKLDLE